MTDAGSQDLSCWIDRWADHRPTSLALEFEGRQQTYAEFARSIAGTAAWLASEGVREGDRVAWLGPNRPLALELLFACARLGAIYLPLNARLTPAEHRWIVDDADPALVVGDIAFDQHLSEASGDRRVLIVDDDAGEPSARGSDAPRVGTRSHPALLVYTSGTTGQPKGAVLDQAALWANATNGAHAHDLTSADRVLNVLPLFHVGGLNIQTTPTFHAGGAVLLHRAFEPTVFLDDVERWQPTWSLLVPATLQAISGHPRFADTDFSSLKGLMTGSSTVPEAVTRPFFDRGIAVGEVYGATETGPTAIHLRADAAAENRGSCGKPSTTCDVRIVDDHGHDVPSGTSGELLVRGPNILREYWNNPEATAAAIDQGWYHTGDVGHVDADGWMFIDDRKRDVVVSGGENIYPAELENVLGDVSELAEFTVIGVPDDRWGEVPLVVAVPAEGSTIDAEEILRAFDGRLARFKHPKAVRWVEALPRTALGKVQKHEVRKLLGDEQL